MNTNDFEQLLARQPLRPVPNEWRQDILGASGAATPSAGASRGVEVVAWWRAWLWPCPQAWAGLAAAWCVILGLHVAFEKGSPSSIHRPAPTSAQVCLAFEEQRRLLAELSPPRRLVTAPAVQPFRPRPRSSRAPTWVIV